MKITIIGNGSKSGEINQLADGGRIKVALYFDILKKEGHDVSLVDLDGWSKRPLSVIRKIKKGVNSDDVILIMGGPSGSRVLIPLVNHFNKKKNKRTVFCPLGIGTLDKLLKNKNEQEVNDFIYHHNFQKIVDNKMGKQLRKLSLVIPQNEILTNVYRKFYNLDNCSLVPNFRVIDENRIHIKPYELKDDEPLRLLFLSRVKEDKGILDLVETIEEINKEKNKAIFSLDIYGEMQLSKEKEEYIYSLKNNHINYYGIIDREKVFEVLQKSFMFALPTKYYGEGTPGSLIESLIAGVPVLVSSFSQAGLLIKDEVDGIIFELGNKRDLKEKLINIYLNRKNVLKMRENAAKNGKKFLYSENRNVFLKAILGQT